MTSSMLDQAARWFSAKKPQPMTPTLSGDETKRSSLQRSVDFAGFLQCVPHCEGVEAMSARAIENNLLPPRYEVDCLWQRAHGPRRNDNRAMNIRVYDIVVADKHAKDVACMDAPRAGTGRSLDRP